MVYFYVHKIVESNRINRFIKSYVNFMTHLKIINNKSDCIYTKMYHKFFNKHLISCDLTHNTEYRLIVINSYYLYKLHTLLTY